MPNLVMATIMAVSGRSVDSALCTRWTYCPSSGEGILISHSESDSDFEEDSEEAFQSVPLSRLIGDMQANGCLLLRMTVMLAWSNRCVPLNKLNR